jgi:hypothetical protein
MTATLTCPVCRDSEAFSEGERVDVGFGLSMGVKAGPDHCERCGYVEQGPDPTDPPIEYFRDCWARGVDPQPVFPPMVAGKIPPRYAVWIAANVEGDGYGKCRETCARMVQEFPELTRVHGTYVDLIWGFRSHFWCVAETGLIVDPTAAQFPSKGAGGYLPRRYYPPELDK